MVNTKQLIKLELLKIRAYMASSSLAWPVTVQHQMVMSQTALQQAQSITTLRTSLT